MLISNLRVIGFKVTCIYHQFLLRFPVFAKGRKNMLFNTREKHIGNIFNKKKSPTSVVKLKKYISKNPINGNLTQTQTQLLRKL